MRPIRLPRTPAVLLLLLPFCISTTGCAPEATAPDGPTPPMAKIVPHELTAHGDTRTDNYYWLNERENPEVISYLEAENAYLKESMAHTEALQEKLFEEIVGRIQKDDESVPYLRDGYYYYTRTEEDSEYRIYCRKKGSLDAEEEVMLDANVLAEGHNFFSLRGPQISSGNDIAGYAVDTVGRRQYTLHFKNLSTGETLPDVLQDVTGNFAWAEDGKTLFYTRQDPQTLRSNQVFRHRLGDDPADDVLIYEETDETFRAFVYKTRSNRFIIIASSQTMSAEYRFVEADQPDQDFRLFLERSRGHEHSIDHFGDSFYIRTNHEAENFRLMKTPITSTGMDSWQEVIPHREDVYLTGSSLFADYMTVWERRDGLPRLRIVPFDGTEEHEVDFGEEAYAAFSGSNYEFDTPLLRFSYSSMTTPWSVFDYNMETREKTLLKEAPVVGDFDRENYQTERLSVAARDGKMVPVSVVYRKGMEKNGKNPLLLYGYGSYGSTLDPTFNSARLSLLDRGFIFVVAHVRGGQTLGRPWYDDGRMFNKMNTFTDFIDVADHLVKESYTSPDYLFAEGGSAGGLLMGAIVNMRPELFKGVHAAVPFVDVITTMMDDSIPLTSGEYDEWGNPNIEDQYKYILSYSPYDNVEAKDYPNLLVTTGLHDSQVQYWEPAKWVAKLRAMKTDNNRLFLDTNMEAGHGGATGRFKRYRRTALTYAFMLDLLGIEE